MALFKLRSSTLGLVLLFASCAANQIAVGPDLPPAEAASAEVSELNTISILPDGVGVGKDAAQIFIDRLGPNPIEGAGPAYIREVRSAPVGDAFEFMLPAQGVVDPAFPDRQRNEIKVYNRSEDRLKGFEGETMTYRWKFRIDPSMGISTRFCHLFQLKPVGGDESQPVLTFTVADGEFQLRYLSASDAGITYLRRLPYTSVRGQWLEASVTVKNSDAGALFVNVRRLDGTPVASYSNTRMDLWRGGDFNRPKWGLYRGLYPGMGEARVQFSGFSITKQ